MSGAWEISEDANIVYICAMCPLDKFKQAMVLFKDRKPREIFERFSQIMQDPNLQKQILEHNKKKQSLNKIVPWTISEKYSVVKINQANPNVDIKEIIPNIPTVINPFRNLNTTSICVSKLKSNRTSLESLQQKIIQDEEEQRMKYQAPIELPQLPKEYQDLMNSSLSIPKVTNVPQPKKAPPKPKPKPKPPRKARVVEEIHYPDALKIIPHDDIKEIPSRLKNGSQPSKKQANKKKTQPPPKQPLQKSLQDIIEGIRQENDSLINNNSNMAILVGKNGPLAIQKEQVYIGRKSPHKTPDIDISEYHAQTIGRLHCKISLRSDLEYYLTCCEDGIIVEVTIYNKDDVIKLFDGCLLNFGGIPFLFFINPALINLRETTLK